MTISTQTGPPGAVPPHWRANQNSPEKAHVVGGLLATLLLHFAVVAAVLGATLKKEDDFREEIEPKMIAFEDVELLALGEEKPPTQLPRIANPEPQTKPPETINLAQPNEPVVNLDEPDEELPEADEKKKKKINEALSALYNPNRPTNEDIPAGSSEGVVGGSLSDAALASLLGTYQTKLLKEIGENWDVPATVPEAEIDQLSGQVVVYVRLSADGDVVSYLFKKRSDNEQFNQSIERVIRRYQPVYGGRKLPLPEDPEVRGAVLRQGLNLKDWIYMGR